MATATGQSQAELIREGVRRIMEQGPPRTFHSMGRGQGSGGLRPRWRPDDLYQKAFDD